jgi:nucleotide-binding universal stress UspA family protein
MERILVAVDFSEDSRCALSHAFELGRRFRAAVQVLHVVPGITYSLGLADYPVTLHSDLVALQKQLDAFARTEWTGTEQDYARVCTKLTRGVESGEAAAILEEARNWRASLIVVGSHGRSMLGRLFLGSVSSRVLRGTTGPVLVARSGLGGPAPKRILAAIDLGQAAEHVLNMAAAWRNVFGAELTVLHVLAPAPEPRLQDGDLGPEMLQYHESHQDETRTQIEMLVQKAFPAGQAPPVVFRRGRPAVEISSHAQAEGSDLLVVGPHEKRGLLDLGDTAMRIAHSCPCPMLLAKPVSEAAAGPIV